MPRSRSKPPLRIAVDTGGTFTDCIWQDSSARLRMLKVFSTPADPAQAIAQAVRLVLDDPTTALAPEILLLHGTTVGTNALLERRGARIAFVTTRGFEDTLEIGRQARPVLYDFFFDRVPPLAPRELRFGLDERVDKDGAILRAPAPAEFTALAEKVADAAPEAVAVSLLFSFANPAHEAALADALRAAFQRAQRAVPLSLSHQVLPEFREYERASTVAMNAYLQPLMGRYLCSLAGAMAAPRENDENSVNKNDQPTTTRIFVMQSSGGLASLESASREPVRTVLSGPAGGVVGASALARRSGFPRIVGFDMGGTSTDVCLVEGEPATSVEAEVAGLPIRVPMLNIHTVGAGGGSLARFDLAGALRVGPQSAGSVPGPICYGRGDDAILAPTVTDANVLLGRLPADRFLGGTFTLDIDRACRVTAAWLQREVATGRAPRGMTVTELAEGIVRVVNSNMEKAIRVVSVEKGYDPRDFSLVAFGGAGALHACELAAALEMPRVIVPAMPGALSAAGILMSDVVKDYSRTVLGIASAKEASNNGGISKKGRAASTDSTRFAALRREMQSLEADALRDFAAEGWLASNQRPLMRPSVEVRYRGQGYELQVPFTPRFAAAFHIEHARRYGYSHPEREVEVVTVRLRASIPSRMSSSWTAAPTTLEQQAKSQSARTSANKSAQIENGSSKAWFDGKLQKTRILERDALGTKPVTGPAIICEYSATTVLPPGWRCHKDKAGALILQTINK